MESSSIEQEVPIHTIGYGNRRIKDFVSLLKQYEIKWLVDVRTTPWSKQNQDFRKERLKQHLAAVGIQYVHMGEQLGGKPLPDSDEPVGPDTPAFRKGVDRLLEASKKGTPLAVMCAELKPEQCHRAKWVGVALAKRKATVRHIDERGKVQSHAAIELKIRANQKPLDLFADQ